MTGTTNDEHNDNQNNPPQNERDNAKEQKSPMTNEQTKQSKQEKPEKQEKQEEMITISKAEYEKLRKERDEFLENWKRERAESLNFRKFLQDKFDKQMEESAVDLLIKLLHVVDEFRRSLENSQGKIEDAYYKGFELVFKQLMDLIEKEGVEVIPITPKKTKFDPTYHEALYRVPTKEVEENTVYEVVFTGFKKGSRVLRPAKVAVTTRPVEQKAPEKENATEGESTPSESNNASDSVN